MPRAEALFDNDARKKLFRGIELAAKAISCTLGPKGKLVLIQNPDKSFFVTKDGVTVSKSISLKDSIENLGAKMISHAASKTNDVAGDGTTTSSVITFYLIKKGMELLASGYRPDELCEAMSLASDEVIKKLKENTIQIETLEDLRHVATVSSNGDVAIGDIITKAMEAVGEDGVIAVEDAKNIVPVALEIHDGMLLDRGYVSPYFVNDNDHMLSTYEDAKVLVCDHKIDDIQDIVPVLENVISSRKALLLIADDFEGTALQALVLNRTKSNLPICAIKLPGYGSQKENTMRDIVALTGAKLISKKAGTMLRDARASDLGDCKKFTTSAKNTTIVGSKSTVGNVKEHVESLKSQLEDVTLSQDELVFLQNRIAKLVSGIAIIKVGGVTELDMIERKHRVEDALNATKAAASGGMVAGGGLALYLCQRSIDSTELCGGDDRIRIGIEMVKHACKEPMRTIIDNAGDNSDIVMNDLDKNDSQVVGYNAMTSQYEDLVKAGIVDPSNVTQNAFKNATNVASLFLSLGAVLDSTT